MIMMHDDDVMSGDDDAMMIVQVWGSDVVRADRQLGDKGVHHCVCEASPASLGSRYRGPFPLPPSLPLWGLVGVRTPSCGEKHTKVRTLDLWRSQERDADITDLVRHEGRHDIDAVVFERLYPFAKLFPPPSSPAIS
jgi:hypothetical protein